MILHLPARFQPFLDRYPQLALIGGTRMFRLQLPQLTDAHGTIYAKAEWTNPGGSVKDRPVLWMLLEAIQSGQLTPDKTILDSSSGNAGIAYAMLGRLLGFKVDLVVPGNASLERKKRIRAHGANLIETDPVEGYDAALRHAAKLAKEFPHTYFKPDQYANPNNWRAHYESTANEILQQMDGKITHFVSGIGTGGTITGVGRRLKEHDPRIQIVWVVPDSFPGIEGLKPLETKDDIVPAILDFDVVDRKIQVSIDDAFDHCHLLAQHGVFVGQSSGANLKAALTLARESKAARVATIFCDIGERYFSTRLWDL